MDGIQTPGDDRSINQEKSLEKQKIDLEILHNLFEQDRSPEINNATPKQIIRNNENYTTVLRENISTLYDPEGKIETSIPTLYLQTYEQTGKHIPVLIKGIDEYSSYLLLPSNSKKCPNIPGNKNEFQKSTFTFAGLDGDQIPLEIQQFLITNRFFMETSSRGYFRMNSPSRSDESLTVNIEKRWEELIQKGKIRFADEEKIAKFSLGITPPSLELANNNIKNIVSSASWINDFPQKKSLLMSTHTEYVDKTLTSSRHLPFEDFSKDDDPNMERLILFDWTNDISNNWNLTELKLPEEISSITAAGLDPNDNFLLIGSTNTLYILDHHKKPMEIVIKIENPDAEFDGIINLREDGSILIGDTNGKLTNIISNLHTFTSHSEKLKDAHMLQRLRAKRREQKFKSETTLVAPEIKEISNEIGRASCRERV